jgi:Domain of unknown function (DUF4431)
MKPQLISAILFVLLPVGAHASCLSYEHPTTLIGKLSAKDMPGSPNYESIADGDKTEHDLFLTLSTPACVDVDSRSIRADINVAVASIDEFQLTANSPLYSMIDKMAGHTIQVSGMLFGKYSAHHHTPVLLHVDGAHLHEQTTAH